jgi:hypothetical protein
MKLTLLGRGVRAGVNAGARTIRKADAKRNGPRLAGGTIVIILAGALRPSPLRQALDIPVLLLPMSPGRTLLDVWLEAIRTQVINSSQVRCVKIVVSSEADGVALQAALGVELGGVSGADRRVKDPQIKSLGCPIEVVVDPDRWRGPGGLVYDITRSSGVFPLPEVRDADGATAGGGRVLVVEGACLPPAIAGRCGGLASLLDRSVAHHAGVIGSTPSGEPAGMYLFTSEALKVIPPVGFFDLKEQLLPGLYARGMPVAVRSVLDCTVRVRDNESYLQAVARVAERAGKRPPVMVSPTARIDPAAHVLGPALVDDRASIADSAIVHESVVLAGARIGSGAVVSRSIIGPSVQVPPDCVLRGQIIRSGSTVQARGSRRW